MTQGKSTEEQQDDHQQCTPGQMVTLCVAETTWSFGGTITTTGVCGIAAVFEIINFGGIGRQGAIRVGKGFVGIWVFAAGIGATVITGTVAVRR